MIVAAFVEKILRTAKKILLVCLTPTVEGPFREVTSFRLVDDVGLIFLLCVELTDQYSRSGFVCHTCP